MEKCGLQGSPGTTVSSGFGWPERNPGPGGTGRPGAGPQDGSVLDPSWPPVSGPPEGTDFTEFVRSRVEQALVKQYEVMDLLGEGGMALVFRARRKSDGRLVALKVVREDQLRDPEARARFEREADLAVRLRHQNVVETLGVVDIPPRGRALVLELMTAGNLSGLLKQEGRLAVQRVVSLLQDAARGLEYAHGMGVIHRDVKPDNIFLDPQGRAKLGDFGIAHQVGTQTLNLHGMAIGSTHYMSPEQIDGRQVTERSDLYSLGCVGWQMLTGQQPWGWERGLEAVIRRQMMDLLPPIRQYRTDVPDHIVAVVEACMQKAPEQRFATAQAFREALDGRPTVAARVAATVDSFALTTRFRPQEAPTGPVTGPTGSTPPPAQASRPPYRFTPPPASSAPRRWIMPRQGVVLGVVLAGGLTALGLGSILDRPTGTPAGSSTGSPPAARATAAGGGGVPAAGAVPAARPAPPSAGVPAPGTGAAPGGAAGAGNTGSPPPSASPATGNAAAPTQTSTQTTPVPRPPDPLPTPAPAPAPAVTSWPEPQVRQAVDDLMGEGRYVDAASLVRNRAGTGLQGSLLQNIQRICQADRELMLRRGLPAPQCP